jgi:hypothetical protein
VDEHQLRVVHDKPQTYEVRCTCGWQGTQRNGKPCWNKGEALGKALAHQLDVGIKQDVSSIAYLDGIQRGRRRG